MPLSGGLIDGFKGGHGCPLCSDPALLVALVLQEARDPGPGAGAHGAGCRGALRGSALIALVLGKMQEHLVGEEKGVSTGGQPRGPLQPSGAGSSCPLLHSPTRGACSIGWHS